MAEVKQIPYGVSSFTNLMEQNLYYVDKTHYLPLLEEQPRYLFFIRPRRFGKSIFINMLHAYYDLAQRDRFQRLFGSLWIGSHPTPLQGQFQVLKLDFSQVGGNYEGLNERFNEYCSIVLNGFMRVYGEYYSEGTKEAFWQMTTASGKLGLIANEAQERGYRLYLILDEYDNFTNIVLNEQGEEIYHALTHASGFYRDVFKKFKAMFERIFITGVSPVTLDDVSSGFNIGWNISTEPQFNMMLGFSETDVREMLQYYKDAGRLSADTDIEQMISDMKPWYDNYCFAKQSLKRDPKMFNCDMVFYYLRHYINSGCAPDEMIDPNTRTDYAKMKRLINLDRLDGDRKGVLRRIADEGAITAELFTSFPASELVKPAIFPSLLFYYGMLTISGTRGTEIVLGIPNNNARRQYYEYMLAEYQTQKEIDLGHLRNFFYEMALNGDWRPALEFIAAAYRENSSVRSAIEGERNLQGFFTAYLSIAAYYLTAPEMELNHGFCDIFLMPDLQRYESNHSYILELKYLSSKEGEAKAATQWQEACEQIKRYAAAPRVRQLIQTTELHCIILQFRGAELVRMDTALSFEFKISA